MNNVFKNNHQNDTITNAYAETSAPTLSINNKKINYNMDILKNMEFFSIKEAACYLNIS